MVVEAEARECSKQALVQIVDERGLEPGDTVLVDKLAARFRQGRDGNRVQSVELRQASLSLELGDMPNGEIAERELVVHNDGQAPLVVDTITTSCGCTTAVLEPMTIAPGTSGTLRITFDSGAHGPDLRGPLLREVMIASNDPASPEVVVSVTANILEPATE